MTTTARTARIDSEDLPYLRNKIEGLNKRAERLGVPGFSLTVLETVYDAKADITWASLEITGAAPKIDGWILVAVLEHTPEGNLIRSLPGSEIDLIKYREVGPRCDHCKTVRQRKDTYIVRNGSETLQVGKSCLKDFTGHELHSLTPIIDLWSECLDGEYEGSGSGLIEIKVWLAYCFAAIRVNGEYISKRKADERNLSSTADTAAHLMDAAKKARKERSGKRYRKPEDTASAEAALAYVLETLGAKSQLSDYEHNLLTVARLELLGPRHTGMAAALASFYLRSLAEAMKAPSEWIGEIKQRREFVGLVEFVTHFETPYGWSSIVKFRVGSDVVVWKTSTDHNFGIGDRVAFKGTIKAHDEYRGERQTTVTRCKVSKHEDRLDVAAA
jgi:hypothetical protein